ncbi:hypothetical protein DRP77_00940, partial [Candidatus Poribacteria bacterium]
MWQGWVTLVLGVWTIIAGFVLPLSRAAVGINFTIVGAIVLGFALWAALRRAHLSWVNVVMGAWSIVASWVLPIERAAEGAEPSRHLALWLNYLIVGVIVIVFSLLTALLRRPAP